jgi:hypothetical protein
MTRMIAIPGFSSLAYLFRSTPADFEISSQHDYRSSSLFFAKPPMMQESPFQIASRSSRLTVVSIANQFDDATFMIPRNSGDSCNLDLSTIDRLLTVGRSQEKPELWGISALLWLNCASACNPRWIKLSFSLSEFSDSDSLHNKTPRTKRSHEDFNSFGSRSRTFQNDFGLRNDILFFCLNR